MRREADGARVLTVHCARCGRKRRDVKRTAAGDLRKACRRKAEKGAANSGR